MLLPMVVDAYVSGEWSQPDAAGGYYGVVARVSTFSRPRIQMLREPSQNRVLALVFEKTERSHWALHNFASRHDYGLPRRHIADVVK